MVAQRLPRALELSALLIDADAAGYLETQEVIAMQQVRRDFEIACQSIALQLLKLHGDKAIAATALTAELARLRLFIAREGFEQDDAILFPHVESHIHQALDRESQKSARARGLSRLTLVLPNAIRWTILAIVAVVVILALMDGFSGR